MKSTESTLRAVHAHVQLDLAAAASAVAEARKRSAAASRQVAVLTERCNGTAGGLRDAMARAGINPALLGAMRRLYRIERRALQESQMQSAAAEQHEQQARTDLADVRNRGRALERALELERRKAHRKQQTLDILQTDDLWMQHTIWESP